ncbi:MAG: hypothetical protein ACI85L_001702 [Pseudomonadota bacterium]|jgi:hypothetical protein
MVLKWTKTMKCRQGNKSDVTSLSAENALYKCYYRALFL